MNRNILLALLGAFLLAGCVVRSGPGGTDVMVVPPLPVIVELDLDPFYFHNGFFYHYHDDHHWTYSRAHNGPWKPLPPGHYPKEVRWKKKGGGWKYRD